MKSRPFGPIKKDDHTLGMTCGLCGNPLLLGQRPSLVVDAGAYLNPDMKEAREKMVAGRVHNAQASVVHWTCVISFDLPRESDLE